MKEKYKIMLILIGGTICTVSVSDVRRLDTDTSTLELVKGFRESGSEFADAVDWRFEPEGMFHTLSENMTIGLWNRVIAYLAGTDLGGYQGIIIAHGTDTLAYSASLFALLFCNRKIPVFLVASQAPLQDAHSNGHANFRCAAECICRGIVPGVYVAYRNHDGKMMLHEAACLQQCAPYDEDFYGRCSWDVTGKGPGDLSNLQRRGNGCAVDLLERLSEKPLRDSVLRISPYVGLNYGRIGLKGYRGILHECFHSGTVAVDMPEDAREYSVLSLIDRAELVYFTPSRVPKTDAGEESGFEIYESTERLARYVSPGGGRARFLYGMTGEMAYVKLLAACSVFEDAEEIEAFMERNVCGEYTGEM